MVGFRKKSQDSASSFRSSGAKADGRTGATSSGAVQRSRIGRTKPTAYAGKGRRNSAVGRRGYRASEQIGSCCLAPAEPAPGAPGRPLDQMLARLPEGPGVPAASQDPVGPTDAAGPATGNRSDAVGALRSIRSRGASAGSVRSIQAGAGQVDMVVDVASDTKS